jgi:serine-type D-Ala-D-Ala carboxypeptidase/endopeptidase
VTAWRILSVAIVLALLDTLLSRQSYAPPTYLEPLLYVIALYFVLVLLSPLTRRLIRRIRPPSVRDGSPSLISAVESGIGTMVTKGFLRSVSVGTVRWSAGTTSTDSLALGQPQQLGPRSILEVGSVTKGVTALLLADLVVSGTVALEDPVNMYLPLPDLGNVTLEDLATHRSGQPRMPKSWRTLLGESYKHWTIERLVESTRPSHVTEQPRYSNLGFALLGHALAAACGTDYAQLARDRILNPLGMEMSGFDPSSSVSGRDWMGFPVRSWRRAPAFTPAGGLKANVIDLSRLLASMLEAPEGPLGKAWVLATTPRAQYYRSNKGPAFQEQRIGLGWVVNPYGTVWHNGATYGFNAWVGANPQLGAGLVALAPSNCFVLSGTFYLSSLATLRTWAESTSTDSLRSRDDDV